MPVTTVFGPPGTGKTTYLARQVGRAVEKFGADKVIVCSLTTTAATEITNKIAEKGLAISPEHVGTLHAICYRAIGLPRLFDSVIGEFNAQTGFNLTPNTRENASVDLDTAIMRGGDVSDPIVFHTKSADELRQEIDLWRMRMLPVEDMPARLVRLHSAMTAFKDATGTIDFVDMIERALALPFHPERPRVIAVDECQDSSHMELELIKKWSASTEHTVIVGDDLQAIYEWRGASVKSFLSMSPPENRIFLDVTHRLSWKVWEYAKAWADTVTVKADAQYKPRDDAPTGSVTRLVQTGGKPLAVMKQVLETLQGNETDTIMILATCGYMLRPVLAALKKQAIPYHNPLRKKRGDWNPLRRGGKHTSTTDRILAFCDSSPALSSTPTPPTWGSLHSWTEHLCAAAMEHGTKALIARNAKNLRDEIVGYDEMERLLGYAMTRAIGDGNLTHWRESTLRAHVPGLEFPFDIVQRWGVEGLRATPRVIVGTMHCSPGFEPILTANRGYVPIEELDPETDRVFGYMSKCNRISRGTTNRPGGNGYAIQKSSRHFIGRLIEFNTKTTKTTVTPNHRMRACFNPMAADKHIVYLMRRGNWWRIGVTKTFSSPYIAGGLGGRLSTEKADAGWVLGLYNSRSDAVLRESYLSTKYGIPTITFNAMSNRSVSSDQLHKLHDSTADILTSRISKLFYDFNLEQDFPLFIRNGARSRVRSGYAFETCAANLQVDWLFCLPVYNSSYSPTWEPVVAGSYNFSGMVYGLHVPPHGHYVSGGVIVHNSVKGGEANEVYLIPDLAPQAYEDYAIGSAERRDAVLRTLYVGITRAKERLWLCSGTRNVPKVRWIPISEAVEDAPF